LDKKQHNLHQTLHATVLDSVQPVSDWELEASHANRLSPSERVALLGTLLGAVSKQLLMGNQFGIGNIYASGMRNEAQVRQ